MGHARRETAVAVGGLLLLVAVSAIHVNQGALALTFSEVVAALRGHGTPQAVAVLSQSRLPRLVAGLVAGASFAMAGVLLQGVLLNDLVSPATLGVNAGAFAASVVATVFFPAVGLVLGTEVAFLGGILAALLVFAASGGVSAAPVRIVLAGVAVTFVFSAVAAVLQLFFEQNTAGLFFWGSGSLLQFGWQRVGRALPRFGVGILLGLIVSGFSQVLQLGDETARARGQRVDRVRIAGSLCGVFLAAVGISVAGPIGFLGLAVPHLLRLLGVRRARPRFAIAGTWGAALLLFADVGARAFISGLQEIPVGLVTTIVGAPVLIVLVSRARRAGQRVSSTATRIATKQERRAAPQSTARTVGKLVPIALFAGLAVVLGLLLGSGGLRLSPVLFALRAPRVLTGLTAGAALAVSGAILQAILRNPLAAPSIVGVSGGAAVGALAALIAVAVLPVVLVPVAALAGAFAAAGLVWMLSVRRGMNPERVVLIGVGISAVSSGVVNLMIVQADVRLGSALTWLSGSLYARTMDHALLMAVVLSVFGLALVPLIPRLDVLGVEDRVLVGVGMRLARVRSMALLIAVTLAGAAVSVVGTISFVGLVGPHASRLLFGPRHRALLPAAALLGGGLVVVADLVGRTAFAPSQIPAGLVAALVGGPYFVWLLWKRKAE